MACEACAAMDFYHACDPDHPDPGCTMFSRPGVRRDGAQDGNSDHRAEGGGSQITSHPFTNPVRPWDRCGWVADGRRCGLSEAAHATTATPYVPDAPRAA